jgi:hypothetical protein
MLMEKRPDRPGRPFTWFVKQCISISVTTIVGCGPRHCIRATAGQQFAIRTVQARSD